MRFSKTKKLSQNQRDIIAEKLMECGNLILIGLAIAQLFPGPRFNPLIAVFGILCFLVAYGVGIRLMKGGGR